MVVVRPSEGAGRGPSRRGEQAVISLRRMTLGSGYRYLMESVAAGDGAAGPRLQPDPLLRRVGHPARRVPRRRPGRPRRRPRGRDGFGGQRAAPVQSARDVRRPDHRQGARAASPTARTSPWPRGWRSGSRPSRRPHTDAERAEQRARIEAEERAKGGTVPHARWPGSTSPSRRPSRSLSAWALADRETKALIYACHRRAIEVVLTYAEREVFHSRSGTNGVVQEDVEGVVATAFTHWDSRAGDPQLHDHVVVANRARSVSDGDVADARFAGPVQVRGRCSPSCTRACSATC